MTEKQEKASESESLHLLKTYLIPLMVIMNSKSRKSHLSWRAATAFVKPLASHRASPQKPPQPCAATNVVNTGVSPSSKARLIGQYIEQLKSLQELRESGVLCEEEFVEQKTFALQNFCGLNKSIKLQLYMHMTVLQ